MIMVSRWLSTPVWLAVVAGALLFGPETGSAQFRGGFGRGFTGVPVYFPYSSPYANPYYNPYGMGYAPYSPGFYYPWSYLGNPYASGAYSAPQYSATIPSYLLNPSLRTNRSVSTPPLGRVKTEEFFRKKDKAQVAEAPDDRGPAVRSGEDVARIDVKVPAGGRVWVNGIETRAKGDTQSFVTPPLPRGKKHSYVVRARWRAGSTVDTTEIRRIKVQPGDHVTVDFTRREEANRVQITHRSGAGRAK
jgi:uncharacterized protein (TIGR03000 family)